MRWKNKLSAGAYATAFIAAASLIAGCCKKDRMQTLLESYGKEMEKEYGLRFGGYGGDGPDPIEQMEVLFSAYRRGSVAEARELQLSALEKLLQKINSNDKIRPLLKEFPFPSSRMSLSISFSQDGKRRFEDGSVALSVKIANQIIYYVYDPNTKSLKSILSENLETL